jgi:hypothetical protein
VRQGPTLAFWVTGADEREDKRFKNAGATARLLYEDAGAWAMDQYYKKRVELPEEWFIPSSVVRAWGKKNVPAALVREGLWKRAERNGAEGYTYAWIRWENTPDYLRQVREDQADAKRRQRAAKHQASEGENDALSY